MGWIENKIAYDRKYYREKVKAINLKFYINNEDDLKLYNFCKDKENTQKFIKDLIKKEFKKSK